MSSAGTSPAYAESPAVSRPQAVVARLADYLELTKPRIAVLVLVTVTVGYCLGCAGNWRLPPLLHALLGIALVAAGSSAINQLLERHTDARMDRTARRPLPAGRLQPLEVLCFGAGLAILGFVYLLCQVNVLTASLTGLTFVLYALVYTPLKRHTSCCTVIGAVPGALPPVLGWTAAGSELSLPAFSLFAILFLWQFPHFLAIAWLYRRQYAEASLRMLPAANPRPQVTGLMGTVYALALLPISLLPAHFSLAGPLYFGVAVLLGLGYVLASARFMLYENIRTARGVLFYSLVYLPALLLAMTSDHLQLLR